MMYQETPVIYDIAAEGAVLGSILLDRAALKAVGEILLEPEWFYRPEHQTLYRTLRQIADDSEGWDLVIIADGLRRHKILKAAGGVEALVRLAETVPTAANAEYYARIVRDKYLLRRMYQFGQNLSSCAAINSLPGVIYDLETQFRSIVAQYKAVSGTGRRLLLRPVSDYQSKPIDWLWPGRFPLGMLSLIAGIQGHGKSYLMCYMAAIASRGLNWADGENPCPPMDAAILSDEESVSYALRPRLEACGADLNRVFVLDGLTLNDGSSRVFNIRDRLSLLEEFLDTRPECRLVFFDSLAGFLGDTDPNDNAAVRQTLSLLTELAERRGAAIVGILHLNKKPDLSSVHRISGANAFTAVARAVWLVAREDDEKGRSSRLLLPVKCNYADVAGLRYRIIDGAVAFDTEAVATSADAMLGNQGRDKKESAVDVACEWLKAQLQNQPAKPARDILDAARAEGITQTILYKARLQAGIKVKKTGYKGSSVWMLENSHEQQSLLSA